MYTLPHLPSSLELRRGLLAGFYVTAADLLPILTAGNLGFLLHQHEALLDTPAAGLGTARPAGPWLHPAPCWNKPLVFEGGRRKTLAVQVSPDSWVVESTNQGGKISRR